VEANYQTPLLRVFKGSVSLKSFQIALRKAGIVTQILDRFNYFIAFG